MWIAKDSSARRESSSTFEEILEGAAGWPALAALPSGKGVASLGSRVEARGMEGVA